VRRYAGEYYYVLLPTQVFTSDGRRPVKGERKSRLQNDFSPSLPRPESVPHKASSASCFCGLSLCRSGCTDGLDERITDGSTESCRCRRRSAADAFNALATHSAGLLGRWLAVESVVRWPIRGDGPTHREGRPRSSSNHIDELLVRPPPEATPASAGRRHILVVKVPPDVL